MAKKSEAQKSSGGAGIYANRMKSSSLLDTRVIYCGDNLEQLRKLPDVCVDLIYIDPPFNSNGNYEVFWGETKEKRAFQDRRVSTQACIDYHASVLRGMVYPIGQIVSACTERFPVRTAHKDCHMAAKDGTTAFIFHTEFNPSLPL